MAPKLQKKHSCRSKSTGKPVLKDVPAKRKETDPQPVVNPMMTKRRPLPRFKFVFFHGLPSNADMGDCHSNEWQDLPDSQASKIEACDGDYENLKLNIPYGFSQLMHFPFHFADGVLLEGVWGVFKSITKSGKFRGVHACIKLVESETPPPPKLIITVAHKEAAGALHSFDIACTNMAGTVMMSATFPMNARFEEVASSFQRRRRVHPTNITFITSSATIIKRPNYSQCLHEIFALDNAALGGA